MLLKARMLGHVIDHWIPVQGHTVSGLDVPWNIVIMPAWLNTRKMHTFVQRMDDLRQFMPELEVHEQDAILAEMRTNNPHFSFE